MKYVVISDHVCPQDFLPGWAN